MEKTRFNFYQQHEKNAQRTRWLNILMPLILAVIVLTFGSMFVGPPDQDNWLGYVIVFALWYAGILLYAHAQLQHPVATVMRANRAIPVTSEMMKQDQKLKVYVNVIEELALAYGMKTPAIYIVEDTMEPNAFAVGSVDESGVAITRPLLDMLNRTEISGVMGHELAHVKADDSATTLRFVLFIAGLGFIVNAGWWLLTHAWWLSWGDDDDDKNSGLIELSIAMAGLGIAIVGLLAKVCATLLRFAMSRTREYDADAMSAQINQSPEGLISALTKIENWVQSLQEASDKQQREYQHNGLSGQYAQLYLTDTQPKHHFAWLFHLLDDHPTTPDRIKRLQEIDG